MDAEKIALTLPADEVRAEAGFIAQIKAEAWRAGFDACKEQAAEEVTKRYPRRPGTYAETCTIEKIELCEAVAKDIRVLEPKT